MRFISKCVIAVIFNQFKEGAAVRKEFSKFNFLLQVAKLRSHFKFKYQTLEFLWRFSDSTIFDPNKHKKIHMTLIYLSLSAVMPIQQVIARFDNKLSLYLVRKKSVEILNLIFL